MITLFPKDLLSTICDDVNNTPLYASVCKKFREVAYNQHRLQCLFSTAMTPLFPDHSIQPGTSFNQGLKQINQCIAETKPLSSLITKIQGLKSNADQEIVQYVKKQIVKKELSTVLSQAPQWINSEELAMQCVEKEPTLTFDHYQKFPVSAEVKEKIRKKALEQQPGLQVIDQIRQSQ